MAKSRMEKNQKLYRDLEEEMKNNKGNLYEKKLKSIDPNLDKEIEINRNEDSKVVSSKKSETKSSSALTVIAKEINGKKEKKNELVKVKEKKVSKKLLEQQLEEDLFKDPISFTDKLSVEEILRAKIEHQEKLKTEKKNKKRTPYNEVYTPEMMQERINQHDGVNVRKEVRMVTKDYRALALWLLFIALISVVVVGVLLIFKIIEI